MSQVGAIIQKGPQHWAIIQQENGLGTITLSGIWALAEEVKYVNVLVYARIVSEEDATEIVTWHPASMLTDQAWEITLDAIPAGGLYRLETILQLDDNPATEWAARGDMINHIGIGDLW